MAFLHRNLILFSRRPFEEPSFKLLIQNSKFVDTAIVKVVSHGLNERTCLSHSQKFQICRYRYCQGSVVRREREKRASLLLSGQVAVTSDPDKMRHFQVAHCLGRVERVGGQKRKEFLAIFSTHQGWYSSQGHTTWEALIIFYNLWT